MEKTVTATFTDSLYPKTYTDVREIRYYVKYNKLLIIFENMECRMITDVEGFVAGTMVKFDVITD